MKSDHAQPDIDAWKHNICKKREKTEDDIYGSIESSKIWSSELCDGEGNGSRASIMTWEDEGLKAKLQVMEEILDGCGKPSKNNGWMSSVLGRRRSTTEITCRNFLHLLMIDYSIVKALSPLHNGDGVYVMNSERHKINPCCSNSQFNLSENYGHIFV